jgi:hypothetical protein
MFGPSVVARTLFYLELVGQIDSDKVNVLVHSRSIFSKDIQKLRNSKELNYIVLSNGLLSAVQGVWLPKTAQEQTFYYKNLPSHSDEWALCNTFAEELLRLISERCDLKGVLSANFDYWQDAGFRHVCERTAYSFMVLRRENEVTKKAVNMSLDRYRNVEIGIIDLAMVFSDSAKFMMETINSDKLKFEKIVVTGSPRLDCDQDFNSVNENVTKTDIVFFTYLNGNYCEDPRNFWEVVKTVYEITQKNKKNLVIKCKNKSDKKKLKKQFSEYLLDPKSVAWSINGTTSQLTSKAICAIAFNSTVLVELLSMPIPLVVPFVYINDEEKNDVILHEAKKAEDSGLFHVENINKLKVILEKIFQNRNKYNFNDDLRLKLLDKYVGWNPGKPSYLRVEKAILSHRKN